MQIEQKFTTLNRCFKNNTPLNVKGIMLHSVGCPQPKASAFFNSFNTANVSKAVHAFVQADGYVMQTLPWNIKAWHCGSSANSTHIGIEMTEPCTIKYTSGSNWKDLDPAKTKEFVLGTYKYSVELFAKLCKDFKLDPMGKNVIICHQDGARLGIASNHADVYHIWDKFGLTMDQFRKDVAAKMNCQADSPVDSTPTNGYFAQVTNLSDGDRLNIRQYASSNAPIIGKLSNNYIVYVTSTTGGWSNIAPNGSVSSKYLKKFDNGYEYTPDRYIATVAKKSLKVRSTPTTKEDNVVGSVKEGQKFTIVGIHGNFGLLLSGAGNINTKYVTLEKA